MAPSKDRAFPVSIDTFRFALVPQGWLRVGWTAHEIKPIPLLAQQIATSTADLTYQDVNREAEVPVAQDDFSGGIARNLRYGQATKNQFRYSKGIDTSVPNIGVLPGPLVSTLGSPIDNAPTKGVLKGDYQYIAAGTKLYQISGAGPTLSLDTTFANPITDLLVWNDKLLVAFGEATSFVYRTSDVLSAAFTTPTGSPLAYKLCLIRDILWRARTFAVYSADNVNGLWAQFDIGNTEYDITSLTDMNGQLIVGKRDGPWALSEQGEATLLMPDLRLQPYEKVCNAAINWNGDYVFTGRHSVYRISGGAVESIGFDELADAQMPGSEYRPAAFTTDGRFMYALIDQSTNPSPVDGVYIWKMDRKGAWHNYIYRSDLGRTCSMLFATPKLGSTDFKNSIMFAYKTGVQFQLAWARYPSVDDPTKDSAYLFDNVTTGELRTLDYTASLSTVPKFTDRVKVVADDLSTSNGVDVWGHVDNATARLFGTFEIDPHQELSLVNPATWYRISLALKMKAGASAYNSVLVQKLRGIHLPTVFHARTVRQHSITLMAVDHVPLSTGGRAERHGSGTDNTNFKTIVDRLRWLRETKPRVSVVDENQREFDAYLVDINEVTLHVADGTAYSPIQAIVVLLNEVTIPNG